MKQRIVQRQSAALAASPEMRLSLRVLKMPFTELRVFLAERAATNPFLKVSNPSASSLPMAPEPEAAQPSLYETIGGQIELTFNDAATKMIAFACLEGLDRNGWLLEPLENIAEQTKVRLTDVERVLAMLQDFEPAGIFARSLAECLRLQAQRQGKLTWELGALLANLDLLADNRRQALADACDCLVSDIPSIVAQLKAFDPKPGLQFDHDITPLAPPELVLTQDATGWQIDLNASSLPAISVDVPQTKLNAGAHAALNEARQLASAIQHRNATVLRVAASLVRRQRRFLDQGRGHRVPVALKDIGAELSLHPSTICRAVIGRIIETPSGRMPLRRLFCRAFPQPDETQLSQDAVGRILQSIVASEPGSKPFSDIEIAQLAADQGLSLARRTVAKYRRKLGIPASYQRASHREKSNQAPSLA